MGKLSLSKYFKSLIFLYTALIFAQLVFILAALYLRTEEYISPEYEELSLFRFVVPLLVFGGLYEGNLIYKRKLKAARKHFTLVKKLADYRLGIIIQYIFWIVPSLFAITAYVINDNWMYLALSGIVVIAFLTHPPGMKKTRRDIDL